MSNKVMTLLVVQNCSKPQRGAVYLYSTLYFKSEDWAKYIVE